MNDGDSDSRGLIGMAIQGTQPDLDDASAVLVGWTLVAEWVDTGGKRWLTKTSADASGDPLPTWTEAGYLHESLNGDWPTREEEDYDGEDS
ncbi:MAG: hypothetical protein NUW01_12980 [Gemmatimonadaceae bacterium]|nr:hypothetical protein [Gemmatimonadaceae bacterium]